MSSEKSLYDFIDLTPYIRWNNLSSADGYYAGDELMLLRDAFDFTWIAMEMESGYQGEWIAVFYVDNKWCLANGYFGSCSGCDALEAEGYEVWLGNYLKNVRAFGKKEDAIEWLETTDDLAYETYSSYRPKEVMLRALKLFHFPFNEEAGSG